MSTKIAKPTRVNYDDLELDDQMTFLEGKPFTGVVYSLHRDGTLASEGIYRDGLPDGLQEDWYPGGQIRSRSFAVFGKGSSESSTWYRNGQLRRVQRGIDGRVVEAQAWDEAGNPIDPSTLGEDNAFGTPVPGGTS